MLTISEFAKRLSNERKRLKMTQAEFGKLCGVKPASQFLYEKGARAPNADYLLKAAEVGVHISYLFQDESVRFGASELSTDDLASLYVESDTKGRDTNGMLYDLEHRVNIFKNLIANSANVLTNKIKKSA